MVSTIKRLNEIVNIEPDRSRCTYMDAHVIRIRIAHGVTLFTKSPIFRMVQASLHDYLDYRMDDVIDIVAILVIPFCIALLLIHEYNW